jgi:hypothetical protein
MNTDLTTTEPKPRAELAADALDYRRQGHGYREIAEQMGLPVPDVIALVQEAVQGLGIDLDPSTAATLDVERIELMMAGVFQDAAGGDINAQAMVLRLMGERQRLEAKRKPSIADLFRQG